MGDTAEEIARDVQAAAQIPAVPPLLRVLCEITGMGFAAVARVTDQTWTACVVEDSLNFGLAAGGQLDIDSTLCKEVRHAGIPIVIDHASQDPRYCRHHAPKTHNIESYISVPIVLPSGRYFGNLCAFDPKPRQLTAPHIVSMFTHFAYVIGLQLDSELTHQKEHSALLDERATSELREQFIAVLGHDLRNPLAAISTSSELLLRRLADPDLIGITSRIKSNARRMSALIDDVLDFARGRLGGGLGIKLREIDDIDRELTAVVRELQDSQPERTIATDIRVPYRVRCDLGRVQQLVSNLVANALTHGAGTTPVSVTVKADGTDLTIEVWNDGEPIPSDKIDQIFKPFRRHSVTESRQGLGLGLYICSEIAKAHGGTLSVTSSRDMGTRFIARIPLGREEAVKSSGLLATSNHR